MNSEIEQDFYEESSQPFWWKILPKYLKKVIFRCRYFYT